MLKLYYVNLENLDKFESIEFLSEYRRNKLQKISNEKLMKQGIGAELLLIEALKRNGCCPDLPLNVVTNQAGKPEIKGCLHFNLSHSGEYIACAISDEPVGVDIQKIVPYDQKLAKRCFTADEYKWLEKVQDNLAFTVVWSTKESYIKLLGESIAQAGMNGIELLFEPESSFIRGNEKCWQGRIGDYVLTCCSKVHDSPDGIIELGLEEILPA